ncbi:MAG: cyclic lactone autoinducer peptide [Bacilli bacterium]|nr:cyclic lactone autoinducer peptide [Bacilli bacterium]
MNNFVKKYSHVLACFSLLFCTLVSNTRCICIFHQPEMPEELSGKK